MLIFVVFLEKILPYFLEWIKIKLKKGMDREPLLLYHNRQVKIPCLVKRMTYLEINLVDLPYLKTQ